MQCASCAMHAFLDGECARELDGTERDQCRRMRFSTIIAGVLLIVPSLATAEGDFYSTQPNDSGITFVRKRLPASGIAFAQSKTIYLNHTGVTLRPGDDDSTTQ